MYSNDKLLFKSGKNHQYSLDFVCNFLEKFLNSKVTVTSRKVEEKIKSEFICKTKRASDRNEKNLFLEKIELYYLPSPSQTNQTFIIDLMIYYHQKMKGSYLIKKFYLHLCLR